MGTEAVPCACQTRPEIEAKHRNAYASLPRRKVPRTFGGFEETGDNREALQAARDFASGNGGNHILTISGPNGNGKSHLLEAIGRDMVEQGYWIKFCSSVEVLDTLRDSYSDESAMSFEQVYEYYSLPHVLLLDDLGAEKPTEWAAEKLTKLVDERYRNERLLAVTTNLDEDSMAERLTSRLADRLFDFRTGATRVVYIEGESYRTGRQWT